MQLVIEVELGNDAMQRGQEVIDAITASLEPANFRLLAGETNNVRDINGNTVGHWFTTDEVGCWQPVQ